MDTDRPHMSPAAQLWLEAEAAVQCELDEDVRLEAHGLAVAEMADVRMSERLAAVPPGSPLAVLVRGGRRYEGMLVRAGSDCIVLRRSSDYLIPATAIVCVIAAPRVLHADADSAPLAGPSSWRSTLRELLGQSVHVIADRWEASGPLTWVGHDHVTIAQRTKDGRGDDLTIAWHHLDVIVIPPAQRIS